MSKSCSAPVRWGCSGTRRRRLNSEHRAPNTDSWPFNELRFVRVRWSVVALLDHNMWWRAEYLDRIGCGLLRESMVQADLILAVVHGPTRDAAGGPVCIWD